MTDMSKYKNVSLTKETYKILDKLSKVLLPDAKLSIAKTIESIANEKARKLNGKIKKAKVTLHICPTCKGNGYFKSCNRMGRTKYINVGTVIRKENSMRQLIWVGLMMVL